MVTAPPIEPPPLRVAPSAMLVLVLPSEAVEVRESVPELMLVSPV
jgi:hypothetical protein